MGPQLNNSSELPILISGRTDDPIGCPSFLRVEFLSRSFTISGIGQHSIISNISCALKPPRKVDRIPLLIQDLIKERIMPSRHNLILEPHEKIYLGGVPRQNLFHFFRL